MSWPQIAGVVDFTPNVREFDCVVTRSTQGRMIRASTPRSTDLLATIKYWSNSIS